MSRLTTVLLVLAVAGCAADDPFRSNYSWQPTGANAGNLAAMAAKPRDLVFGRGGAPKGDRLQADAVERVWEGRARPLNGSGSSATGSVNTGRGTN
jgi:type IV pilus biogenesis protein CpaD/CtpE